MKFGKMRFFLIALVATFAVLGVLLVPKYNGYDLPALPESEYQNAYIAVSGDTAYLYFVDKKGYIEVDPDGFGNIYTLGLTTTDPYDESKILYAEKYTATIGGDSWTAEELPDFSEVYDIPAYAQFSLPCEIGGPVWSNVTLLDQDGNVFIEGTNPIDTDKAARRRYSSTLGYLMALCGPVIALPSKQPTAYSYNGVVLPKLPEWDREMYPYAIIGYGNTRDTFMLTYRTTAPKASYSTYESPYGEPGYFWMFFTENEIIYELVDGEWVLSTSGQLSIRLVWTNTDIYYSNSAEDADGNSLAGVLALAASEPVPVNQ